MIEYGKKYWVWMCHHVSWGKQKLSRNFNLSIWIWEIFAFINIVWNEEVVGCQMRCKGCEQEQRWICGMKPSNVSLIPPAPALITVHINYRAVANIGLFEIHFSTVCIIVRNKNVYLMFFGRNWVNLSNLGVIMLFTTSCGRHNWVEVSKLWV